MNPGDDPVTHRGAAHLTPPLVVAPVAQMGIPELILVVPVRVSLIEIVAIG